MLRLSYRQIASRKDNCYANQLKKRFGGAGVEASARVADFCAEHHWCVVGGAGVVLKGATQEEFDAWHDEWDKLWEEHIRQLDAMPSSSLKELQERDELVVRHKRRAWRLLFKHANRIHRRRQLAKMKRAA